MPEPRTAYSANVVLQLALAGQILSLSQVGPGFCILRELPTVSIDTDVARVDVIIDQRVASSRLVFLPHGVPSGSKRVVYF